MSERFPKDMKFYGFEEFYKRRVEIRDKFDLLDKEEQYQYKSYVYMTPFVSDYIRNTMWDYLERYCDTPNLSVAYTKYKKKD